jgi:multidrug efflux pump subunit AcrA (membrane-fusion protein)
MKKTLTVPLIAVLVFIVAVGAVLGMKPARRTEPPPSPPPASKFASSVGAVGLIEANTENIDVSCAVSGMVTQLFVKAGDRVQHGQKLFSLDDRDLEADLIVKRAMLNGARTQLAKLRAEPRPEELPPLEAKVTEAQALVADAEVQVQLIESVTDSRAVRKEDVLRRRQNYEAAKARLAQAEKDLALTKAGAWKPDLEIAETQVAQAEAAVHQDEVSIERLTTRAPIEGTILQNKVRLGQYAQCGPLNEPLMILGSVTPFHVRVDVDEHDAGRVRNGGAAVGSPRGNGSLEIPLEFVRFEPYVIPKKSLTGDSTERVDTRVLQVIYRVKDQNAALNVGQQMDVYIQTPSAAIPTRPQSDPAKGRGQ